MQVAYIIENPIKWTLVLMQEGYVCKIVYGLHKNSNTCNTKIVISFRAETLGEVLCSFSEAENFPPRKWWGQHGSVDLFPFVVLHCSGAGVHCLYKLCYTFPAASEQSCGPASATLLPSTWNLQRGSVFSHYVMWWLSWGVCGTSWGIQLASELAHRTELEHET